MTHRAELLERYPAVAVLVGVDDGFVHNLLQLCVFQVVAHHHLEHLEQFTVGDVAILVHVVDPECDCKWVGSQATSNDCFLKNYY